MGLTNIDFTGPRKGTLLVNDIYWRRIAPDDKKAVLELAAGHTSPVGGLSGRSCLHQLKFPSSTIKALRFKGLLPDLPVRMHTGSGYVPSPLEVDLDGTVHALAASPSKPEKGAFAVAAEWEWQVADALGPALADHAVGFGIFDNIRYKGAKLGFTIFGQESADDLRLRDNFYQDYVASARLKRELNLGVGGLVPLPPLAALLGKTMRKFHQFFIHHYPHFGNIGIVPETFSRGKLVERKVILRDFDTCTCLPASHPQQLGYLGLDLFRVLNGLWAVENHLRAMELSTGDLVSNFTLHYFDALPAPETFTEKHYDPFFQTISDLLDSKAPFNMADFLQKQASVFSAFLFVHLSEQVTSNSR